MVSWRSVLGKTSKFVDILPLIGYEVHVVIMPCCDNSIRAEAAAAAGV
jgi:hypothetical protein